MQEQKIPLAKKIIKKTIRLRSEYLIIRRRAIEVSADYICESDEERPVTPTEKAIVAAASKVFTIESPCLSCEKGGRGKVAVVDQEDFTGISFYMEKKKLQALAKVKLNINFLN